MRPDDQQYTRGEVRWLLFLFVSGLVFGALFNLLTR